MATKKRQKNMKIGEMDYERIIDWSGGMNDAVNPALLADNESALLENASLDEKGTLFPRKGSRNRYAAAAGTDPVTGMGAYYKSDGTSRLLIGAGSKLYTDNPHVMDIFNLQDEFETGTVEGMASTTKKPGSVVNDGTPADVVQEMDTDAQWNAGTKEDVVVSGDKVTLAKVGEDIEHKDETDADWDAGTHDNTEAVTDDLVLLYDDITGEYAETGTWTSPAIDLTALEEEASSLFTWYDELPNKTAIFLEARTSTDGTTWGDYQQLTKDSALPAWEGFIQYRIYLIGPHDAVEVKREDNDNDGWSEGVLTDVMAAGGSLTLADTITWESIADSTWDSL